MKKRSKILLFLELIGIPALLLSCAIPKVPSSVSWDTEFTLPIAAHTYHLSDVAKSDSVLYADGSGIGMTLPDSALFFSYTRDLNPIHPGDHLTLDAIDHTMVHPMQALRIPLNMTQTHNATLGSLNPAIAAENGLITDVPPFAFQVVMDAPLGEDFSMACADSGQIEVRIQSTLPYPVNGAEIIWMADRDNPVTLYTGLIGSEVDTSYSSPLEGRCLTHAMFLQVSGTAAGGSQVLIDSTQGVTISISAGEMLASTYVGRLPRQQSARDSVYDLNQQHEVHEGLISVGHLTVTATNATAFADSVDLTFANLRSPSGGTAMIQRFLNPGETAEDLLDLTGYIFRPNEGTQQVQSRMETVTPATDYEISYQTGDQHVTAEFRTDELHFQRFDGIVHHLQSDITRDSTEVDHPPDGWENLHPASLDMRLTVNSRMPVESQIQLLMFSERQGSIIGTANRSVPLWLGHDTTVVLTGLGSLVPRLPERIGYSGIVLLEGPVTVYDTTTIRSKIELTAPLHFTLDNTHVPGRVSKVDPDAMDNIHEISLTLHLWNALPLSGTLRLIAASDSAAVLDHSGMPAETLCTVTLPPAQAINGRVALAGSSICEVTPPSGCYDLLEHPPFYVRPDLTLNGSAGDTLSAYGTDYATFSATAQVRYRISSEH